MRIDTHGGRYCEGLDVQESYAVLDRHKPQAIRAYRTDHELKHLIGTGGIGGRRHGICANS